MRLPARRSAPASCCMDQGGSEAAARKPAAWVAGCAVSEPSVAATCGEWSSGRWRSASQRVPIGRCPDTALQWRGWITDWSESSYAAVAVGLRIGGVCPRVKTCSRCLRPPVEQPVARRRQVDTAVRAGVAVPLCSRPVHGAPCRSTAPRHVRVGSIGRSLQRTLMSSRRAWRTPGIGRLRPQPRSGQPSCEDQRLARRPPALLEQVIEIQRSSCPSRRGVGLTAATSLAHPASADHHHVVFGFLPVEDRTISKR